MFTALDTETGNEIIILAPSWADHLGELRRYDHKERLVCPECRQLVRVRAGEERRWHFAHRHKADCTYGHDDPAVVEARALLYKWLVGKFGEEAVSLERRLEGSELPRPVDLWVRRNKGDIAYWIFGKGVSPTVREGLQSTFYPGEGERPAAVNWLFVHKMLRPDSDDANMVNLNTTERAFLASSPYNACVRPFHQAVLGALGGTLHYLDAGTETLTTYRGLSLVHEPAIYAGTPLVHPLSEIMVVPANGELVHPGEHERLTDFRQRKEAWKEERKLSEQEAARRLTDLAGRRQSVQRPQKRASRPEKSHFVSSTVDREPQISTFSSTPARAFTQEPARCIHCGEVTPNWWHYDPKTGTCQCRPCRDKKA